MKTSTSSSTGHDVRGLLSQKKKEAQAHAGGHAASASGAGAAALSGKDKVAMLKRMRELEKQQQQAPPPQQSSVSSKSSGGAAHGAGDRGQPPKTQKAPQKPWPLSTNFPDDYDVVDDPATVTAPRLHTTVLPPSAATAPAHTATVPASSSSLPQGFFDNPYEDSKARGVDLYKLVEAQDKESNLQLKSFLEEIQETNELQEEADAAEEDVREQESEAIQMSYEVRYAGLLTRASKLTDKSTQDSLAQIPNIYEEGNEVSKALLPMVDQFAEDEVDASVQESHQGSEMTSADSIEAVMRAKRKEAKKLKKQREAEEYVPLDASDWMARYV
jgi:hypothetical protein